LALILEIRIFEARILEAQILIRLICKAWAFVFQTQNTPQRTCLWMLHFVKVGLSISRTNADSHLYCPISLLHARVSQVFLNTCMRVCGGVGSGFVSACSWLALVSGVGGCVLAEVEIGVLSCMFLYFCRC
jgi:hypothetical protein